MDISKIIKEARLKKKLSQQKLASLVGVTRSAVALWERGDTAPKRKIAPMVAEILDISLSALAPINEHSINTVELDKKYSTITLMDQDDISSFLDGTLKKNSDNNTLLKVDPNTPEDSFAVILVDDSMEPLFAIGDIIIISRKTSPEDGDVILVEYKDTKQYLVRNYNPRGLDKSGKKYFDITANNPSHPTYTCSPDNSTILGTITEHRRILRR